MRTLLNLTTRNSAVKAISWFMLAFCLTSILQTYCVCICGHIPHACFWKSTFSLTKDRIGKAGAPVLHCSSTTSYLKWLICQARLSLWPPSLPIRTDLETKWGLPMFILHESAQEWSLFITSTEIRLSSFSSNLGHTDQSHRKQALSFF